MYLLPACIFSNYLKSFNINIFVLSVLREIISESSEQNQCDQTTKKYDHHETVEDAEPMDSVLEEIILQITIKARLKGFRTFHPVDRISKLDLSSHIDGNWIF